MTLATIVRRPSQYSSYKSFSASLVMEMSLSQYEYLNMTQYDSHYNYLNMTLIITISI